METHMSCVPDCFYSENFHRSVVRLHRDPVEPRQAAGTHHHEVLTAVLQRNPLRALS